MRSSAQNPDNYDGAYDKSNQSSLQKGVELAGVALGRCVEYVSDHKVEIATAFLGVVALGALAVSEAVAPGHVVGIIAQGTQHVEHQIQQATGNVLDNINPFAAPPEGATFADQAVNQVKRSALGVGVIGALCTAAYASVVLRKRSRY